MKKANKKLLILIAVALCGVTVVAVLCGVILAKTGVLRVDDEIRSYDLVYVPNGVTLLNRHQYSFLDSQEYWRYLLSEKQKQELGKDLLDNSNWAPLSIYGPAGVDALERVCDLTKCELKPLGLDHPELVFVCAYDVPKKRLMSVADVLGDGENAASNCVVFVYNGANGNYFCFRFSL